MTTETTRAEGERIQPNTKPHSPKRKIVGRVLLVIAILLVIAVLLAFAWLRLTDNSAFTITFYEVDAPEIRSNVRIVYLSDLHLSQFGEDNIDLVESIRTLNADFIAMGGDMINQDDPDVRTVLSLIRQLVEIAPVYYVYGNHESIAINTSKLLPNLPDDLKDAGAIILNNRYVTLDIDGNLIDLGGMTSSPTYFNADYIQNFYKKYMESENYRLLLTHYPNYFWDDGPLNGADIDMALCGHLHGGQVVIPYLGGLYHTNGGLFPKLASGCTRVQNTWVVTSRGLGNSGSFPRVNNPPELVVLDLY